MKRSKKKALTNRKLTIIKVLPKNGNISQEDLNRWHKIFAEKSMTAEEATKTGEVTVQSLPIAGNNDHFITLVKVGNEEYQPTVNDLEQWRLVFEEASKDPDFKIFTHDAVSVEVIPLHQVLAIE